MHSAVLGSMFLPKSQEMRLVELLARTPRFSPWGVQNWDNPLGHKFQTIDQIPVPEAVLSRNSDHAAVVTVDRYTNLVHADSTHVVLTSVRDVVPCLHVIELASLNAAPPVPSYRNLPESTYFPFVNRTELRERVPGLPRHIHGYYIVKDRYFVWTWDSHTGHFSHQEIEWFNRSMPDRGTHSIEKIARDRATGILVGEGAGIPPFVMTPDGSKLLAFVRTYSVHGQPMNTDLINHWRERTQSAFAHA